MSHLSERHREARMRAMQAQMERMVTLRLLRVGKGYRGVSSSSLSGNHAMFSPAAVKSGMEYLRFAKMMGKTNRKDRPHADRGGIQGPAPLDYHLETDVEATQARVESFRRQTARRVQQRVKLQKELETERMRNEMAKRKRDTVAAVNGVKRAEERILEQIGLEVAEKYASVDELVKCQASSIDAMHIARLLSPRFEERLSYKPMVTQEMEHRIREIMQTGLS